MSRGRSVLKRRSFRREANFLGDPEPQIAWLHNDTILPLNGSADDAAGKYAILPDGSLRIANASATDAGFYECVANSPTGQARARRAQLIAAPQASAGLRSRAPTFTLTPKDTVVREGTVVKLHCEAAADPRPVISWYHNNRPLRPSRRLSFARDDTVLTIYPFIEQDVGRSAVLTVTHPPPLLLPPAVL